MKKIKIGVIGCGSITASVMIFFKLTRGYQVAAFCDKDIKKAVKLQKQFNKSAVYEDYQEMISNEHLDAVYVALPHFLHYPVLKELISHQLHILVEKPVTTDVEQAKELSRLADENHVKVAVNYQYRYDKALYQLEHSVQNNELGELFFARCIVPWHRDQSYFQNAKWHASMTQAGGGTLITQGSHLLDVLLNVFNSDIQSIEGLSKNFRYKENEVEDFSSFTITFKNGSLLQFISTLASPVENRISLEIYCKNAVATYSSKLFSKVNFTKCAIQKHFHGVRGIHPIHMSIKAFRNWLLFDQPHLCPIEDSIKVLETVKKIYDQTLSEGGK
ncbi:MAG: Gfo/Idh/MocA family oxidoreductase [Clostridia bacterium]|nr:Gfo/Idh/MocA family oxidoreductase [Clostridia bacterium]